MFSIPDGSFKSFENYTLKLLAKETKWTSLGVKKQPVFLESLISKYGFGPVKLPGLSRNGPQAFWHFDKLILLVESSQYFCILICIFFPAKHYQSRREIYTALFSADQIREFGSSQSCAEVDFRTEFKSDPEAKLETEYENAQEVESGTDFNTDPKVERDKKLFEPLGRL